VILGLLFQVYLRAFALWSMNFVRIGGNIFKEKRGYSLCVTGKTYGFCTFNYFSDRVIIVNHNCSSTTSRSQSEVPVKEIVELGDK
jgi:hypothetical protein